MGWYVDDAHLVRDGAIGLFVGAAGLSAALRPRWAWAAVGVAAIGVGVQFVAGAIDSHRHDVDLWFEMLHVVTVAIFALTAMVAGTRAATPAAPARRGGAGLRSVAWPGTD